MAGQRRSVAPAGRTQLGQFWLWYRGDRDDWCICWYDDGGPDGVRRTGRKSTGIGGGSSDNPPKEAQDALAEHYLASQQPVQKAIDLAYVEGIMADWLLKHAQPNLSDPVRYANSVAHWIEFFADERRAGRLTGPPTVADINTALVQRFQAWRIAAGVSPHTASRDTAALRQPLNWAWKNNMIASAPFVPDIKDKPGPKELVYTVDQIAALLDAARAEPDREHIAMLVMIALSTHGRMQAILELTTDQIQGNLIYFNAPGRRQTKKRRSIVPIAPTLAPWLEDLPTGKVIQWKKPKRSAVTGKIEYELLPAGSVKKSFEKCLLAAGISAVEVDDDGEPVWLPPRAKLGETAPRPKLIGLGSPNTLRHTISTELHRRGVPEAQIDTAAGHSGDSTNKRHYRHLRPDYLKDFIEAVEDLWSEVGKLTTAHLRYQRDTKVVDMGAARSKRKPKNG